MPDNTWACTPPRPTERAAGVRYRRHARAEEYVSAESLGRSSVAGGGSSFPSAWRLPPLRRQTPAHYHPPAARPRPNALSLVAMCARPISPLPIRARRCARNITTLYNCGGFPPPCAFPPLVQPLATLYACSATLRAHATHAAVRGFCLGRLLIASSLAVVPPALLRVWRKALHALCNNGACRTRKSAE